MQRLTSAVTGDKKDQSNLPAWDRVKSTYKCLKKHLNRDPTMHDEIGKLFKKKPKIFEELVACTGERRNNANKYFKAASLGAEFMELFDEVNDMHMQCTFFKLQYLMKSITQLDLSCTYTYYFD
jgi:hypothetical protein